MSMLPEGKVVSVVFAAVVAKLGSNGIETGFCLAYHTLPSYSL